MERTRRKAGRGEGELLSPGLVHELRQPLTGLDAGLKLVARDLGESVTKLESWKLATGQMARMVEVLETYQRLMAPGGSAGAPFAADVVARRVIAIWHHRLEALSGGFALVIEPGLPLAHGSPQALQHALDNLVTNALEAIEAGTRGGRVEVRVRTAPGPAVQVRVSDDGPGIPAAARRRLFTRRFTTKEKGSGLGLGIARRMMRASGGEVRLVGDDDAARRPWARTEFAVDLAAAAGTPAPHAAEPVARAPWRRGALRLAAGVVAIVAVALGWTALQRWMRADAGAAVAARAAAAPAPAEPARTRDPAAAPDVAVGRGRE